MHSGRYAVLIPEGEGGRGGGGRNERGREREGVVKQRRDEGRDRGVRLKG